MRGGRRLFSPAQTAITRDNVSVEDELSLKTEARELGLLVMGPDCGTAIINGTPLAFANKVPVGDIGVIGASIKPRRSARGVSRRLLRPWPGTEGRMRQDALPELSCDERELLISGTCGACFDKLFPSEDE